MFETRFVRSLHLELFYALQVLTDHERTGLHNWVEHALDQFPFNDWPLKLPPGFWPAISDVFDDRPVSAIEDMIKRMEDMPVDSFQRRILLGLFHFDSVVEALLAGKLDIAQVITRIPRKKREWLTYIGLYPVERDSEAAAAIRRIVDQPLSFRSDVTATISLFWDCVFKDTWFTLQETLANSLREKRRQYARISLPQFLRHTLLPIEFHKPSETLRAIRGGYELPLGSIKRVTCIPSVFNISRLWTCYEEDGEVIVILPYLEPGVLPGQELSGRPDIALIFRALGDATRFAIASLIARAPRTGKELADILAVSKPTISHHTHILRSAGLINETSHGASTLISLNRPLLEKVSGLAIQHLFHSETRLDIVKTRRT